jgi:hypothetical protein
MKGLAAALYHEEHGRTMLNYSYDPRGRSFNLNQSTHTAGVMSPRNEERQINE